VTLEFKPASFTIGHTVSRISSMVILVMLIGAGAWRIRKMTVKEAP
jgi:flagellar biogenesis protein FliO